jgi:hypothetical protein
VNRGAVAGDDGVFVLARFERDRRNRITGRKRLDRPNEAIVNGPKQGRGGNRVAEMIMQEIAEAA